MEQPLKSKAMRALHAAQRITVPRKSRAPTELLLEAVRKHFRQAISQDKIMLATFVFAKRPAELPVSPAADSEKNIVATDVVDLATLKAYRTQHTDLQDETKEAINFLSGG